MAKVSASTLVRRASKTKDKAVAKRLRAQAARIRREARTQARDPDGNPATGGSPMVMHHDTEGGWKEIGHDTSLIAPDQLERLRNNARINIDQRGVKAGTIVDSFAIQVRAALIDARIFGKREAEKGLEDRFRAHNEAHNINVVSAFLAEISAIAALNKGPLPRAVMVSGYTLARVVDALRQAGYTEDGKGGFKRPL